jgi:hypothetical protein
VSCDIEGFDTLEISLNLRAAGGNRSAFAVPEDWQPILTHKEESGDRHDGYSQGGEPALLDSHVLARAA